MTTGSFVVDDSVASQGREQDTLRHSVSNVFQLLAQREITPRTRHSLKRLWGDASKCHPHPDARSGLLSWVEAESLLHFSAKYCPLMPPPRSTIAAAFSLDGKILASTHGDHTVKIVDYQSGTCLKVLSGHRRTPWVVRFHPIHSDILASGSLDHEVRLWDASTAECIGSLDFYRPIASIAFHAQGDLLAVASGHKLYIWRYNKGGDGTPPAIVLKTRRSLRAVHFHPHAAPFLLTAEVNEIDTSDSSMILATAPGNLRYPSPTVFLADGQSSGHQSFTDDIPLRPFPFLIWPSLSRDVSRSSVQNTDGDFGSSIARQRGDTSGSVRLLTYSTPSGQYELLLSPIESNSSSTALEDTGSSPHLSAMENEVSQSAMHTAEAMEAQPEDRNNQPFQLSDLASWDLPFLHGWLTGETPAGQYSTQPFDGAARESSPALLGMQSVMSPGPPVFLNRTSRSRTGGRSGSRHYSSRSGMTSAVGSSETSNHGDMTQNEGGPQPVISRIQSELAASLATVAVPELPCTVKLRIWSHDIKDPCAPLDPEKCRLTIPHAVLCSEMGAHFSPCGRFLVACVACVLPNLEAETGLQGQMNHDATGASTSPTRHPISAHHVVYELRIYSLEEATFGVVLASRAIRAAHCLTSIQFSPTSEHLLLAYGRRHCSLLRSVIVDGETTVPIYTILEVYRVSDMELVRVLPSAEDEVNVACFHPSAGGGLVYGTKEGKLRILQYESSHAMNFAASGFFGENIIEVPTYALEC